MAVAAAPLTLTTEEMLALPQDGTERWLIRGRYAHVGDAPAGGRRHQGREPATRIRLKRVQALHLCCVLPEEK
jgi:hypothetical protein